MFCSPFSIAFTSLEEDRANLSAFPTFARFALVWLCLFPFPLRVWDGHRLVMVALLGLFSYLLCIYTSLSYNRKLFQNPASFMDIYLYIFSLHEEIVLESMVSYVISVNLYTFNVHKENVLRICNLTCKCIHLPKTFNNKLLPSLYSPINMYLYILN